MKSGRQCSCGMRMIDGRCSANPSCSDFKKPRQSMLSLNRKLRERERAVDAIINLPPAEVRDAYERSGVDGTYAAARAVKAKRMQRGRGR